ncbi:M23 family metallopeptidase [Paenibacillus oenotherae]|uniref:M23 family metallopeptidase n=2 Tax=Paenibacillus oenotherae TaxID=1435645 RepID=A0ABS7D4I4_9BACL|nr:M23 family metallopeptidase [Paenibacillus oenotherae]
MMKGEYERLYTQFSQELKDAVPAADFKAMGREFLNDVKAFREPSVLALNGMARYVWMNTEGTKSLTATYDESDTIVGIQIQNVTSHPETDEAGTKISYGLPFKGEWLVFWGGDNEMHNYHYALESQRYAYDLVKEKDGKSYEGDRTKNESYYAFGEAMLAPADGKVAATVNDIADNEPVGTMNSSQPAGNYVVIDHGNGEYSYLAHLKKGTVKVKKGETVKKGQEIGLCGNSGNSSEPHLHFQVSDGPDLFTSKAISVTFSGAPRMIQGDHVTGVEQR